jgi:hypothetical protein
MVFDPKTLVEIIAVFGPAVVVALVLAGLLFKIGRDLLRHGRN